MAGKSHLLWPIVPQQCVSVTVKCFAFSGEARNSYFCVKRLDVSRRLVF